MHIKENYTCASQHTTVKSVTITVGDRSVKSSLFRYDVFLQDRNWECQNAQSFSQFCVLCFLIHSLLCYKIQYNIGQGQFTNTMLDKKHAVPKTPTKTMTPPPPPTHPHGNPQIKNTSSYQFYVLFHIIWHKMINVSSVSVSLSLSVLLHAYVTSGIMCYFWI